VSSRIAGRDSGPASDQPVYLSRRKLAGAQRRISREAELESILATKGHRIVYPEEISFEDQVRLFNSHKTFTGCIGSAFHSVLFAREDTNVSTVVFARETVGVNYLMIDKIKSTSATYIKCLEDDESSAKESTFRDQVLDIDVALFHLRLMGIL
jgi:capsular polysaccharide biosynthesis protein